MATTSSQLLAPFGIDYLDIVTNGTYWELDLSRTLTWATAEFDTEWEDPVAAGQLIANALAQFSRVANIHFEFVGHYDDPTTAPANMVFSGTMNPEDFGIDKTILAWGFFPNEEITDGWIAALFGDSDIYPDASGDVWINLASEAIFYPTHRGSDGFFLFLHEIGHALGLKHPHDDGATGGPTAQEVGLDLADIQLLTVMSYHDGSPVADWFSGNPGSLMPLDILALQRLYGPNNTTRADNTVYRLTPNQRLDSLWDAGGIDRADASTSKLGWEIDLNVADVDGHVIGFAAPIGDLKTLKWFFDLENVTGSPLRDKVSGSDDDNRLAGGAGNDILIGRAGSDTLIGGPGIDLLRGGAGDDRYFIDNAGEIRLTTLDPGIDTVLASMTYTLGTEQENLTLRGGSPLSGSGNSAANTLIGNDAANILKGKAGDDQLFGHNGDDTLLGAAGADYLDGGAGRDAMDGGAGDDVYVVNSLNDKITDSSGLDTVVSSISYRLPGALEDLELIGTKAINGTGNSHNNYLGGNSNVNILVGAGGDDVLDGFGGADILSGGAGFDTFVFSEPPGAIDRVTDFETGIDILVLLGSAFPGLPRDDNASLDGAYFKLGASADDNDFLLFDPTQHRLSYDPDADGPMAAIAFAQFSTVVDATDIFVVTS